MKQIRGCLFGVGSRSKRRARGISPDDLQDPTISSIAFGNDVIDKSMVFFNFKPSFKFLCINDLMDHTKPESETAKKELEKFYETIYPHKSEFEI